jgi:hypothetical protein
MYSMMQIDAEQSSAEMSLYEEYREGLDGDGWFDGSEISAPQMDYVERAIYLTVNPGITVRQMGSEYRELAESLFTKDMIEFLDEPNAAVRAKFDCAYGGSC